VHRAPDAVPAVVGQVREADLVREVSRVDEAAVA
jgi:hypothetical protein